MSGMNQNDDNRTILQKADLALSNLQTPANQISAELRQIGRAHV